MKPYQEFFLHKKMLIVAHNDVISYYNTEKKKWKAHYKFNNLDGVSTSNISINTTFSYSANKVQKVFSFESKDSSDLGIGVLFQNG